MLLEVEGIVLSETPYGETSKIINLYTKEKIEERLTKWVR